ncbi:MAG: TatD family hydrolase [Parcubacteria group bacterium]
MIDTHAHIDDHQFGADREDVIARAFSGGVEKIITIGAGLGSSERAVAVAKKSDNIFAVVGLHPEYFMKHGSWSEEHKNKLEELARAEKVVAIGEIGLEYHSHDGEEITLAQKEFQKEGFVFQLELAKKLKLPVVIHCRGERAPAGEKYREMGEAYEDVLEILEEFFGTSPQPSPESTLTTPPPRLRGTSPGYRGGGNVATSTIPEYRGGGEFPFVVFHSFGGRLDFAKKVMARENVFFSFNGNLTYAKSGAEILEVVKIVPLEKIMLETDCPYLAPVPHRGKRNEPAYVKYVCDKIAEIKGITSEKVDESTSQNAVDFFRLA